MSAPVRPPLSVTDGTTTVRPTNGITFDSADGFTVTKNGTNARIDFTGGGSATLTDTYIGFGSGSNLLTGSANFTFTEESGGNGPAVLLTGDKPVLKLQDDTAATTYRTEFLQSGASQYINSKDSGSTNNEMFRIDPTYIAMQRSMTANVGIGTIPESNIQLHVKGTGTDAIVKIESSDAGADSAPDLVLFRNSASPAANDYVGTIDFKAQDAAGNEEYYGRIMSRILDTSATHAGQMLFKVAKNGSVDIANPDIKIQAGTGIIFNEGGFSDMDFRVESDTKTHALFVDAGNNLVGIMAAPATGVADNNPDLQVAGSMSANVPIIVTASATSITLTNAQMSGHVLWFGSGSTITVNLPDGVQGDHIKVIMPAGDIDFQPQPSGQINGATAGSSINRNSAQNEILELICVSANKWYLNNP